MKIRTLGLICLLAATSVSHAAAEKEKISKNEKRFLKCFQKTLESRKVNQDDVKAILELRDAYAFETSSITALNSACKALNEKVSSQEKIYIFDAEEHLKQIEAALSLNENDSDLLNRIMLPSYVCEKTAGFTLAAGLLVGVTTGADFGRCTAENGKSLYAFMPTLGLALGLYIGVDVHTGNYISAGPTAFMLLADEDDGFPWNGYYGILLAKKVHYSELGADEDDGATRGYGIGIGLLGSLEGAIRSKFIGTTNWRKLKKILIDSAKSPGIL